MDNRKITIFKNLFKTDVSFTITLKDAVKRIRDGKSQTLIESIRKEKDKEKKRNDFKKETTSYYFLGCV